MTEGLVDFATLQLPDRPSRWLIAPVGATAATPDAVAPPFPLLSADELADRLETELASLERTTRIARVGRRMAFVQRSRVFQFPDAIAAEAIALPDGGSAPILYSVSRVGYFDFGVNRARLEALLDRLRR
ncbi:MAG: DUF1499 domain-containing protein [Alphaproteobacteria bacterium]|nr:MAG: DUF1499 domain-containing protein [Alphaproteobacteria bacterium]